MRKKTRCSKRTAIFLLLPLCMIAFATVAYGVLNNYVAFNINLALAQKPTIAVACALQGAYENSITLIVNSTTKLIERTEPAYPLIHINITNTGKTPVDKITLNNTISDDWTLRETSMQLVQVDKTRIDISATYFTTEYSSENIILITVTSIKNAVGRNLNQNESIIVSLYIEYKLKGEQLPLEYETIPPIYSNTANAVGWVRNYQSEPANATAEFTTYIYYLV